MILMRHGQTIFNVHFGATREDPGVVDPGLTDEGKRQVEAAARTLRAAGARRIVASPYSRALETAAIVAETLALPVEVESLVRERAHFTCDIGTPAPALAERWPGIDFSDLPERWWPERETLEELLGRCHSFRLSMASREDWSRTLVVSHWGFIRGLTGEAVTNAAVLRFDPTLSESA
jgi:broad specificity phosphatase PhoE